MAATVTAREYIALLERGLSDVLKSIDGEIGEAMRYAVLDGGKRVRPLCVYYGAKSVACDENLATSQSSAINDCKEVDESKNTSCIDVDELLVLGEAIELIHSYSLVHDDMPEMDNDDYRRGKLSVHKKYGAGVALLVGDGLLSLAMKLLTSCKNSAAAEHIGNAALDMVYGQAAELAGCNSREEYLAMYAKKTGALIRGALLAGATSAIGQCDVRKQNIGNSNCADNESNNIDCNSNEAKSSVYNDVLSFAEHLGVAFQLADDLLDDGASIADLIGREETSHLLDEHTQAAIAAAKRLHSSDELIAFAELLWHRKA